MPDIVLHIGYPKTATTFLQTAVWPANFPCAGKCATTPGLQDAGKTFARLYHRCGPPIWGQAEGQNVVRQLAAEAGGGPLVVSNEELLKASVYFRPRGFRVFDRQGGFAAIDHLARFARDGWGQRGRVRVVLGVRRQVDWLGSSYAQHSDRLPASQADFEARLRRYLRRGARSPLRYLAYSELVAGLQAALGSRNVAVLAHEDLKAGQAPQILRAAFPEGISVPEPGAGRGNRRSAAAGQGGKVWQLRPPRARGVRGWWRARRAGPDPGTIAMPAELEAELQAYFAEDNKRLADLIGRSDLGAYGYW